jgi:hypothetical protein
MRGRQIKQWLFTLWIRAGRNTWKQKRSTSTSQDSLQNTSPPWQLHKDCFSLPLANFIECLCDESYTPLIVSGDPPLDKLQEAWLGIYIQFVDLTADIDSQYIQRLDRDIKVLQLRLTRIDFCIRYLSLQYDEELVQVLRKMNFRFKFNPDNRVQYTKDLQAVIHRTSPLQMQLEMKQAELKAYQDKQKGEKPDRIYFTKILTRLGEFMHFRIDPKVTTVAEFAIMKKDYVTHCENLKNQVSRAKRR